MTATLNAADAAKLQRSRDIIITQHPFFSSTLMRHRTVIDDSRPTAWAGADDVIHLNPDFVAARTTQELVFLQCHECWHIMLRHVFRCGARCGKKWNWATDAWINEGLIAAGIGDFIEGGIRYPGAETMSADQLYNLAPDDPPGGGGGSLGPDLDSSGAGDMTADEIQQAEFEAKQEMAKALFAAEQAGTVPASLRRMIEDALKSSTPWYDLLAPFMTRQMEVDYDFSKPDPYFLEDDIVIPDLSGDGCGEVVVVGDESGSISDDMRRQWSREFRRIIESCEPETLHILHTSTEVAAVSSFDDSRPFRSYECRTTGGTDMGAGLAYAGEHYPHADVCIVLTDGYTPWGTPPPMPVVWLVTTPGKVAPFGETIYCDLQA